MAPFYRFMTGAGAYRIEARNREEALRFILEELRPTDNTKAIILSTLYDEAEKKAAVDEGSNSKLEKPPEN